MLPILHVGTPTFKEGKTLAQDHRGECRAGIGAQLCLIPSPSSELQHAFTTHYCLHGV